VGAERWTAGKPEHGPQDNARAVAWLGVLVASDGGFPLLTTAKDVSCRGSRRLSVKESVHAPIGVRPLVARVVIIE